MPKTDRSEKYNSVHKGIQYSEIIHALNRNGNGKGYAITLPGKNFTFEDLLLSAFEFKMLFVVEKEFDLYLKLAKDIKQFENVIPIYGKLEDFLEQSKLKFQLIFADFCGMACKRRFSKDVISKLEKGGVLAITESNRPFPDRYKFKRERRMRPVKLLNNSFSYEYSRTMEFRIFKKS